VSLKFVFALLLFLATGAEPARACAGPEILPFFGGVLIGVPLTVVGLLCALLGGGWKVAKSGVLIVFFGVTFWVLSISVAVAVGRDLELTVAAVDGVGLALLCAALRKVWSPRSEPVTTASLSCCGAGACDPVVCCKTCGAQYHRDCVLETTVCRQLDCEGKLDLAE
jgi:hypothetical protein